jgi:hypothetical protein
VDEQQKHKRRAKQPSHEHCLSETLGEITGVIVRRFALPVKSVKAYRFALPAFPASVALLFILSSCTVFANMKKFIQ